MDQQDEPSASANRHSGTDLEDSDEHVTVQHRAQGESSGDGHEERKDDDEEEEVFN
jgi:hypothetical protein